MIGREPAEAGPRRGLGGACPVAPVRLTFAVTGDQAAEVEARQVALRLEDAVAGAECSGVVVPLLAVCRFAVEQAARVGRQVVLDAVTGEGLRSAIPAATFTGPARPVAERVAQPFRAGVDFAVGELVADLALFAAEAGDRAGEAVAFAAD